MPPADPAALASAVATVRQHWAEPERYSAVYLPALELIAHHSISLLDAGELVRKVKCTAVGWHHGDPCDGGRVQSPNAQFTRDCTACRGTGFVTEPLLPEVRT